MNKLNLYGPLGDLGYGIYTRGVIKGLAEQAVSDFHLSPIGPVQIQDQQEKSFLINHINTVLWDRAAPSIAIWHEFDLNKFSGKKLLAYPIFETTKFNHMAINYLKQMDAVLALSKWSKQVIEENIGTSVPVFVVPGASDCIETEKIVSMERNSSAFTILNVGKLEIRKSQIELIKAYDQAFSNSSTDTRLICHCYNPFDKNFINNITAVLKQLGFSVSTYTTVTGSIIGYKGNSIVEIPRTHLSTEQLYQVYRYCHLGVFPSKGEGWNLPLMEAIKSGLPCIATNYSAHTEYLTTDYNYPEELLLNNLTMKTAQDNMFFRGDRGDWAAPNIDEISEKLLYCYKNYESVSNSFNKNTIKEKFTWSNTAKVLLNVLEETK